MVKARIISISHSIDPDGIGAQAIIFRYFRKQKLEPIGFLCDYHNFEYYLRIALSKKPKILIISDIGLNDEIFEISLKLLNRFKGQKIWIDHHKITSELKIQLAKVLNEYIHDTNFCAAELVQKRFLPDDVISQKIALISHNGDFDKPDRLANIYFTLIDYFRDSLEKLFEIREIFIKGDFDNKKLYDDYLIAYKIFEVEKDRIKDSIKQITIAGKRFAIAYSSILPRGKIAKFLEEICDEEILLSIDTTNFRIGLRSEKYDVAAIAKEFGGGGHKNRSGFIFNGALDENMNLSKEFIKKMEIALQSLK